MEITTGDVSNVNSEQTPTVCIPKEVMDISVVGPYREKERKLWAYLIHRAFEHPEFGRSLTHEIDCREVAHIFKSITGTKCTRTLWQYIENLGDIKVFLRGKNSRGITHLLAFAHVDFERDIITYQIPAILEEFFLKDFENKSPFSRLRTHFLIGLNGKYSVSLYMLLENYVNRDFPILVLTLDELRKKFRVEEGKLTRWQDLRRFVIEPAMKEINEKTVMECENGMPGQHGAGFTVAYETIKKSRKVISVRFIVTKHTKCVKWEKSIKEKKTENSRKVLPMLRLDMDYVKNTITKLNLGRFDIHAKEQEWRAWLSQDGKSDQMECRPETSFIGFLKMQKREGRL